MIDQLKRGEVWLANLDPTQGSEQAGVRTVIIFQNDIVSQFSTTTITIPLTTSQRRASLPIYDRPTKNLKTKPSPINLGELLNESEIEWLKNNEREYIIIFAQQKNFTDLKSKYDVLGYQYK